jgi:hypothetical protein
VAAARAAVQRGPAGAETPPNQDSMHVTRAAAVAVAVAAWAQQRGRSGQPQGMVAGGQACPAACATGTIGCREPAPRLALQWDSVRVCKGGSAFGKLAAWLTIT